MNDTSEDRAPPRKEAKGTKGAHEILRRLDEFKSLMVAPLADLEAIEPAILSNPIVAASAETLEFQTYPADSVHKLLPWPKERWTAVVQGLRFVQSDKATVVAVLDLLTALCIIMCGELKAKAQLLFKWYNLNQQGLLEEEEHYLMLRRIGGCLRKLRLIGHLDLTDADAKFLAIKARVVETRNESRFRPGLYLKDFQEWISTSEECKGFFMFIKVMNRLIDMLRTLGTRSEKLQEIMHHKDEQTSLSLRSADPASLEGCADIFQTFKSPTSVSFCIPARPALADSRIYVEVLQEVPVAYPLYSIDQSIIERHPEEESRRMDPRLHCCQKYYTLRHVVHCPARNVLSPCGESPLLQRVDVPELQAGTRYEFRVLHDRWKYQPVRVLTPSYRERSGASAGGICILPASLSAEDFLQVFEKNRSKFREFAIVLTGSMCDLAPALQIALDAMQPYAGRAGQQSASYQPFYTYALQLLHRQVRQVWSGRLRRLCRTFLATDGEVRPLSTPFSQSPRQLVFYQGRQPLQEADHEHRVEALLGDRWQSLQRLLSRELAVHMQALVPPRHLMSVHSMKLFMVSPCRERLHRERKTKKSEAEGWDVFSLIDRLSLPQRMKDDQEASREGDERIVVLMQSPADLLFVYSDTLPGSRESGESDEKGEEQLAMWTDPLSTKHAPGPSLSLEEKGEATKEAAQPLRGRYELLHGEYPGHRPAPDVLASSSASSEAQSKRPAFQKLVEVVFSYLHSSIQSTSAPSKAMTFVSCNWVMGCNFELRWKKEDKECVLSHHCLLPCANNQAAATSSPLLQTILDLLPPGVEYVPQGPTETRAVLLEGLATKSLGLADLHVLTNPTLLSAAAPLPSPLASSGPTCSICGPVSLEVVDVHHVQVSVQVRGQGMLVVSVYDLPMGMTHATFVALVGTQGTLPTPVARQWRWNAGGDRTFVLHFPRLLANGYYGVGAVLQEARAANTFRTLPLPSPGIFSLLLCPMGWKDCTELTARQQLLEALSELPRGPRDPLFAVYCDAGEEDAGETAMYRYGIGLENRPRVPSRFGSATVSPLVLERVDPSALSLSSSSSTVLGPLVAFSPPLHDEHEKVQYPDRTWEQVSQRTLFPRSDPSTVCLANVALRRGISIQVYGNFCCVVPRNASNSSIQDAAEFIAKTLSASYPTVRYLILVAPKTLVYALSPRDESLTSVGLDSQCFTYHMQLLDALVRWKAGHVDREARILGCGAVSALTTVLIGTPLPMESKTDLADGVDSSVGHMDLSVSYQPSQSLEGLEGGSITMGHWQHSICVPYLIFPRTKHSPHTVDSFSVVKEMIGEASEMESRGKRTRRSSSAVSDMEMGGNGGKEGDEREEEEENEQGGAGEEEEEEEEIEEKTLRVHPGGIVWLLPHLCYEVLSANMSMHYGISFTHSHGEWYREALRGSAARDIRQSVVYRIDCMLHGDMHIPPVAEEIPGVKGLAGDVSSWIFCQEVVNSFDMFQLVLGPVQGVVSPSQATLLVEVNMAVPWLTCVLRPMDLSDEDDGGETGKKYLTCTVEGVAAFSPCTFAFTELKPNTRYEVILPHISPRTLSVLRTPPRYSPSLNVLVTGDRSFDNMGIVQDLLQQILEAQVPHVHHLQLLNAFVYEEDRVASSKVYFNPSMWGLMGVHSRLPGNIPMALLHLAPQIAMATLWKAVEKALMGHSSRLLDPALEGPGGKAWKNLYLNQLEEVVKDTIRVVWSHPSYAFIAQSFPNMYLHTASYAVASTSSSPVQSQEEAHYREVIQKIWKRQVGNYILALQGSRAGTKHYFRSWQVGPVAFAMLDLVSNRLKARSRSSPTSQDSPTGASLKPASSFEPSQPAAVKETDAAEEEKEEDREEDDTKQAFSNGFLDRSQWKALRAVAMDSTLYQLVILMEYPLLSPHNSPPVSYIPPITLPEGSVYPWTPTLSDLETFLQFWVAWIEKTRKASGNAESRSVLFITTHPISYVTVMQDLRTGIKLHQMAVGHYSIGAKPEVDPNGECLEEYHAERHDLVLSGKIGSIRYQHKLADTVNFRAESFGLDTLRAHNDAVDTAGMVPGLLRENNGYAELKLLLDTWKPTCVWSNVDVEAAENAVMAGIHNVSPELAHTLSDRQLAALQRRASRKSLQGVLLLGPVLGAPYLVSAENAETSQETTVNSMKEQVVMLPVMIELDSEATITVTTLGLFGSLRSVQTVGPVPARRAFVFEVGPLHLHDRYRVVIGGIQSSPFNSFSFSTHFHPRETNTVVLNCESSPNQLAASLLMNELRERCIVPFNGLAFLAHCNFQPDLEKTLSELQNSKMIAAGLAEYRSTQIITAKFKSEMVNVQESLREMWRGIFSKPSYRELLRSSFNLFLSQMATLDMRVADRLEGKAAGTWRFLELLAERLRQEYIDQLRYPALNVHRSVVMDSSKDPPVAVDRTFLPRPSKLDQQRFMESILADQGTHPIRGSVALDPAISAATAETISKAQASVRLSVLWSDPQDDVLVSVLKQWIRGCVPAPAKFPLWKSLNGRLTLEQFPSISDSNIAAVEQQLRSKEAAAEVRMVVVSGDGEERLHDADNLSEAVLPAVKRFWNCIAEWKSVAKERDYCVVCPSLKHGSRKLEVTYPLTTEPNSSIVTVYLHTLDSIYRSSEFERRYQLAEREKAMPRKKLHAAAAKSKRAQKKKEEEERIQQEALRKEMAALLSVQTPDGYLLLQCLTETVRSKFPVPTPPVFQRLPPPDPNAPAPAPAAPAPEAVATAETEAAGTNPAEAESAQVGADRPALATSEAAASATGEASTPSEPPAVPSTDAPAASAEIPEEVHGQAKESEYIDTITQMTPHYIGDRILMSYFIEQGQLPEGTRIPEKYDLLQIPFWIEKFCPNTPTMFAQDEVVLVSRQNTKTKAILKELDLHVFMGKIIKLYERSRLSELSRPPDLREVDFSVEGVTTLFFKDLLQSIWLECMDITFRETMFDITDDFVRSFCFSQCMGDVTATFANARAFAKAVHVGLRCALELKMAHTMSTTKRFEYILEEEEDASRVVSEKEDQEKKVKRLREAKQAEWDSRIEAERILKEMSDRWAAAKLPKSKQKKPGRKGVEEKEEPVYVEPPEPCPEEWLAFTKEELHDITGVEAYDSDLEDLHKEFIGSKKYELTKKVQEEVEAEEKELKEKAERDASKRSTDDFDGEIDEDVMKNLTQKRLDLLLETLPKIVDEVIDVTFEEGVQVATDRFIRDLRKLGDKLPTDDERRDVASQHLDRINKERFRTRQAQGMNAAKFL